MPCRTWRRTQSAAIHWFTQQFNISIQLSIPIPALSFILSSSLFFSVVLWEFLLFEPHPGRSLFFISILHSTFIATLLLLLPLKLNLFRSTMVRKRNEKNRRPALGMQNRSKGLYRKANTFTRIYGGDALVIIRPVGGVFAGYESRPGLLSEVTSVPRLSLLGPQDIFPAQEAHGHNLNSQSLHLSARSSPASTAASVGSIAFANNELSTTTQEPRDCPERNSSPSSATASRAPAQDIAPQRTKGQGFWGFLTSF